MNSIAKFNPESKSFVAQGQTPAPRPGLVSNPSKQQSEPKVLSQNKATKAAQRKILY
jgi:hypothetical protein